MSQRSTDAHEAHRPAPQRREATRTEDAYPQPAGPDGWGDLVRAIVDAAPQATEEQRAKLLVLLRPAQGAQS
jgi:hypothetical protein